MNEKERIIKTIENIHHSVHNYPHKDKLIIDTMKYYRSLKDISNKYGQMYFENLDDFFLEIVKFYKLGTKIMNPRTHFLEPHGHHKNGHTHQVDTGIYYLQIPKNSGNLFFHNLGITIEAQVDHFIVVPSNELHGVTMNKSNEIRIALAFDIEQI